MPIIVDGNKQIDTPVKTLLEALRQQCSVSGNGRLRTVDYKAINARVPCPIHKDGQETTPACDVLLEDKISYGRHINAGTVHCFACGYQASFVRFVKDCLNVPYRVATEWLLNVSSFSFVQTKRDVQEIEDRSESDPYADIVGVTTDELRKYDYIHPYMFQRKLTDEIIEKFEVGYSPTEKCVTFPVYVNGKCIFVAKRKVAYKKFIMPPIDPKPIYGADYLTGDEVIVCESVFNALTCYVYGKEAVALFGTGSEYQIEQLKKLPQRKIILALDGDNAGRNGARRIAHALTNKIVTFLNVPDGKDINDLTREEFNSLEETF